MIYTAPRQTLFGVIIIASFCLHTILLVVSTERQIADNRTQKGERLLTQLISDSSLALTYEDRVSLSLIAGRYSNEFDVNRIIIRDVDGQTLVQTGDAPLRAGKSIEKLATRDKTVIGNVEITMKATSKGEIVKMLWLFILGSLVMHFLIWLIYGRVARPTQEQLRSLSRDIYEHYFSQYRQINTHHTADIDDLGLYQPLADIEDTENDLDNPTDISFEKDMANIQKDKPSIIQHITNAQSKSNPEQTVTETSEETKTTDAQKNKKKIGLFANLFSKKEAKNEANINANTIEENNPTENVKGSGTDSSHNQESIQASNQTSTKIQTYINSKLTVKNSDNANTLPPKQTQSNSDSSSDQASSINLELATESDIFPRIRKVYTSPSPGNDTPTISDFDEHSSDQRKASNPLVAQARKDTLESKSKHPMQQAESSLSEKFSKASIVKKHNISHDLSEFLSSQKTIEQNQEPFIFKQTSNLQTQSTNSQVSHANIQDTIDEGKQQRSLIPETVQVQISYIDEFHLLKKLSPTVADPYFNLCGQLLKQASIELLKQPNFHSITMESLSPFTRKGATLELQSKEGNQNNLTLAAVMLAELYKMLNEIVYDKHRELGRFAFAVAIGVSQAGRENAMQKLLTNKAKEHDVMMLLAKNELTYVEKHIQLSRFDKPTNVSERECAYVKQPDPATIQLLTKVRNTVLKVDD